MGGGEGGVKEGLVCLILNLMSSQEMAPSHKSWENKKKWLHFFNHSVFLSLGGLTFWRAGVSQWWYSVWSHTSIYCCCCAARQTLQCSWPTKVSSHLQSKAFSVRLSLPSAISILSVVTKAGSDCCKLLLKAPEEEKKKYSRRLLA